MRLAQGCVRRFLGGAPGDRTLEKVKVPRLPGSGKVTGKARVSVVRRNLKEDGGNALV